MRNKGLVLVEILTLMVIAAVLVLFLADSQQHQKAKRIKQNIIAKTKSSQALEETEVKFLEKVHFCSGTIPAEDLLSKGNMETLGQLINVKVAICFVNQDATNLTRRVFYLNSTDDCQIDREKKTIIIKQAMVKGRHGIWLVEGVTLPYVYIVMPDGKIIC